MHLYVPFALCGPLVDILEGEHLDVHQDDGHRLVLVVPVIAECHSPYPVPDVGHPDCALGTQVSLAVEVVFLRGKDGLSCMWSGHLIKAELEEGKVLVESNTSLQTIFAGEEFAKRNYMSESGSDIFPFPVISLPVQKTGTKIAYIMGSFYTPDAPNN